MRRRLDHCLVLWGVLGGGLGCAPPRYDAAELPAAAPAVGLTAETLDTSHPNWCDGYDGWGRYRGSGSWVNGNDGRWTAMIRRLQGAAVDGCHGRKDAERRDRSAKLVARWMESTGLSPERTRMLLSELVVSEYAIDVATRGRCGEEPLVAALTCQFTKRPSAEYLDRLELTGELTAADRVAYLSGCRGSLCDFDGLAVDWNEAARALDDAAPTMILRALAGFELGRLKARYLDGTVPPASGYGRWKTEVLDPAPDLVPRVAEVIYAAVDDRQIPSCPEGLFDSIQARLRGASPTTGVHERLSDPLTSILFRGLALCDRSDPRLTPHRQRLAHRTVSLLGPRSFLAHAAGDPVASLPPRDTWGARSAHQVSRVERSRDGTLVVSFAPQHRTEPVERCREVARARGSRGTTTSFERCRVVGKDRIKIVPRPIVLDAALVDHVRKGETISFAAGVAYGPTQYVNGRPDRAPSPPAQVTLLETGTYWYGFDLRDER